MDASLTPTPALWKGSPRPPFSGPFHWPEESREQGSDAPPRAGRPGRCSEMSDLRGLSPCSLGPACSFTLTERKGSGWGTVSVSTHACTKGCCRSSCVPALLCCLSWGVQLENQSWGDRPEGRGMSDGPQGRPCPTPTLTASKRHRKRRPFLLSAWTKCLASKDLSGIPRETPS